MFNAQTFAGDMIREIKAAGYGDATMYRDEMDRNCARIVIEGSGYIIRILGQAGRSEIRAFVPAGDDCEAKVLHHSERPILGETTFDSDRTAKQVFPQLKRRILEPAKPLIEKMRATIAERNGRHSQLEGVANAWRRLYPFAEINMPRPGDYQEHAKVHMSKDGRYVDGELYADGSFYVRRTSRLPAAAATALFTALYGAAL